MPTTLTAQIRSDAIAMLTPHPVERRYIVSVWVKFWHYQKRMIKGVTKCHGIDGYVAYITNDGLTQHRTRAALFSFDDAMSEMNRRGRGGCVEPIGD